MGGSRKTEKEKEEDIWRRKIYFLQRRSKQRRKRRKIFGEGKYFLVDRADSDKKHCIRLVQPKDNSIFLLTNHA